MISHETNTPYDDIPTFIHIYENQSLGFSLMVGRLAYN